MSPNLHGFVSEKWGLFFADFYFRGRQHPRKIIFIIIFHENRRVGGTTGLSLDRSTVRKENLQTKYLQCKGIKGTCILTYKQTKRTYLHSDGWIPVKWLFRTKQWNVCLACLLLKLWKLCHTTEWPGLYFICLYIYMYVLWCCTPKWNFNKQINWQQFLP